MSIKGPDLHVDYGFAYPVRVEADTSLDFTGATVVFRIGVLGPVAGTIAAPLVELTLGVTGPRTATGVVPALSTRLDPDVPYGYHVEVVEQGYLVVHGRLTVERSVGSS